MSTVMRRRRTWMITTVVLVLVGALVAPVSAGLADEIARIKRTTDLGGATVGVSVIEADDGQVLVDINADEAMIPASNMKLLTTGTALHVLGSRFRFETRLVQHGDRLVIVGDGDPAFGDPTLLQEMTKNGRPMDPDAFLDLWVAAVVKAGITHVRELVVDDRVFDRAYVHPEWPADQLNRRYCAEVSGLAFHLNVLHFFPSPRPGGGAPDVSRYEPHANWLRIRNKATSRRGTDDRNTMWIARPAGTNNLTFYGNTHTAYRTPVPVTVHAMPSFFARLLADRLRAAGVRVDSAVAIDLDAPPTKGEVIGPTVLTSIATALTRCNVDSQNLYAESLLKRSAHAVTRRPGSWTDGRALVRNAVHERLRRPALTATVEVADGSGLSRGNRVAPAALTAWLKSFDDDENLGPVFIESLAVAGENGTMKRRLRHAADEGVVVHAKSGYIKGVVCLSGYVTDTGGQRRCFSVMINDLKAPVARAKKMADRMVIAIARDMKVTERVGLGSD